MMKQPCVYIMSNKCQGVLYVGVTSDLAKRVWQHKYANIPGFTSHYCLYKLVYFECYEDMYSAITREKQLKKWRRDWKLALIEGSNPTWEDLYSSLA